MLTLAGVALAIQLSGCGDKGYTCRSNSAACGKSSQTCCSEKDCYYSYAGNKYQCDGTDCTAAAERVVAAMCAGAPGAPNASAQKAGEALRQTAGELATKANGTRCPVCP